MKSKLFFFVAILATMNFSLKGQEFLPFVNDNYAGITGVHLNPASIANSRYIVDISLGGFSLDAFTNYLSFNIKDMSYAIKNEGNYEPKELLNGKDKWGNIMASAHAFNFMVSITPKVAIGFTNRMRVFTNMQNLDENVTTFFYHDRRGESVEHLYYDYTKNNQYTLKNMSVNMTAFAEYGATLAGVLFESPSKKHFVKGGITVKMLQGCGAMYLNTDQMVFEFYNKDSIGGFGNANKTEAANVSYGVSDNWITVGKKGYEFSYDIISRRLGVGFDIGFVYEWRPEGDNFMEEMDCKVSEMKYKNKYKLRVGFSVTDLGWLTYKKALMSNNMLVNGGSNLDNDFGNMTSQNGALNGINETLNELMAVGTTFKKGEESEFFRTTLPTAISLQVDYHIWKGFYVNFTPFVSLYQAINVKDDVAKIHSYSIVSITPRFEHKWFGFSIPLQYNQLSKMGFAVGAGLRLGPLWVGTNDLISLCSKDKYGVNVQAALKVPIMYNKKRDKDGDGISNRKDKCKNVSGTCEYQGCPPPEPDKDGDGVPDKFDKCPDKAGPAKWDGCPDSDGDGIPDHLDDCPDEPGLPEFNGCPDSDGDGIPDKDDKCPYKAGPAKWDGCPDSDGDGIPDHLDKCPNVAGVPELDGCPPEEKEEKEIPEQKPEPKVILVEFAYTILFETGQSTFTSSDNVMLDSLVSILKKNPKTSVNVEGHTDNVGNQNYNLTLSQKRADAVKDYLIAKGIDTRRIVANGLCDTKPTGNNNTPEGRTQNRRVNIKLIQ